MRPIPWSYSSLDDFVNCPRAYYEKRIAKSVVQDDTPELREGNDVHKQFELYVAEGRPLGKTKEYGTDLTIHQTFLDHLVELPGQHYAERKVAFDKKGQPCDFWAKDVWGRIIIDFTKVSATQARVIDYKTGKPHSKFKQLKLAALHIFAEFESVQSVEVGFYWTKTQTVTKERYSRMQVREMWSTFLPDLRQYKEAFNTDTWQPRQSGLCNGWCPVQSCEFWRPKRTG